MKNLFLSLMAGVLCGISASAQSTLGGLYQVVTSTSDFAAGDTIILVSYDESKNMYAMGTYNSSDGNAFYAINIGTTTADYLPSTITLDAANTTGEVYEYRVGKENSKITLKSNSEYVHADGTSLTLSSSTSGSSYKWTPYIYSNNANFPFNAVCLYISSSYFISYLSSGNFKSKNVGGIYNNDYMLAYCYKKVATNQAFRIGSTGYATMYYSSNDVELPDGLTAYTMSVTKEGGEYKLHMNSIGTTVPHGTGVIVKGTANTDYYPTIYSAAATTANDWSGVDGNMLHGTDSEAMQSNGSGNYFKLADHATKGVGFYWGAEDGTAFTNSAHKAYLFLPDEILQSSISDIPFSELEGGVTLTRIIESSDYGMEEKAYDIAGRRMQGRGLSIMGGKKILKK